MPDPPFDTNSAALPSVMPSCFLNANTEGFDEQFAALARATPFDGRAVDGVVAPILADVRARGDEAVIEYTQKFDGFCPTPHGLRVHPEEIATASAHVPQEILAALKFAHGRILAFHEKQRPQNLLYEDAFGITLGWRWLPLEAVGLYVPGGTASYPSSVLMNAVPAKVAGVPRIVMVAPAPNGLVSSLVLAAAHMAGVDEIYRIGGAQAIAALAYGTKTIAPVAKIVGPGNAYVAAAKRLVFGTVGIDSIAGPSEVVIVADDTANAEEIAADLLAQAEHDVLAQAILITSAPELAVAVCTAVDAQLTRLPRAAIARESWEKRGAVIVVPTLKACVPLLDMLAPEHLELMVDKPLAFSQAIRNAGAIFLGRHTPEAIGDYVGGPNHVLPTARAARYASGLNVLDFMKRTTLLGAHEPLPAEILNAAEILANAEGLSAHARSVALRKKR